MANIDEIDIREGLQKLAGTDMEENYEHARTLALNGDYDLALVKIRPVVTAYPGYPQAVRLMALLCLKTGDPVKAYMVLKEYQEKNGPSDEQANVIMQQVEEYAKKNGYLLKTEAKAREKKEKREKQNVIIPTYSEKHELLHDFLCIAGGLILGVLACMYLIYPSVKQQLITENNSQLMNYSEEMQAKDVEVRSLQTEIDDLNSKLSDAQEELNVYTGSNGIMESYATLINCMQYFVQGDYLSAAKSFSALNATAVSNDAYTNAYNAMQQELLTNGLNTLVEQGKAYYKKYNYDQAIECYQEALKIKSDYPELMYNIGLCYYNKKDKDTASTYFYKLQTDYADTIWSKYAKNLMPYTPAEEEN